MSQLRLAVVGTGHLGKIHAKLAKSLEGAELVAIVDPVPEAREALARELGVAAYEEPRKLIGVADAAIVAVPTVLHHRVGMELLAAGLHVFMEKPLAANLAEANELVAAARTAGRVLQVGHIERFTPALAAALPMLREPKYIEAVRSSGYTFRSTDIGVVLDLMIHDLDIVLSLVQSPVVDVEALGVTVFGPHEDLARARLIFENGCVASLSASRASYVAQRAMQVYTPQGFAALDFATRTARIVEPHPALAVGELDVHALPVAERMRLKDQLFTELLPLREIPPAECNPLAEQQRDFVASIRTGRSPRVTGEQGRNNLAVAERILAAIAEHRWDGTANGRTGPNLLAPLPASIPAPHFLPPPARRASGRSPSRPPRYPAPSHRR